MSTQEQQNIIASETGYADGMGMVAGERPCEGTAMKPCPHCGETSTFRVCTQKDGMKAIICQSCQAQGPPVAPIGEYPRRATERWNDREPQADTTAPDQRPFDELTEQEQAPYHDEAGVILIDLHWCTRVWEAWNVGTMTRDDFVRADEDDEIVGDTAKALYDFVKEQR